MTWVNTKVEPGIGAMMVMIPFEFIDAIGGREPNMTDDPVGAIKDLIVALEAIAGLTEGCQGWLYDRCVDYHAAVLSVAHVDFPKRNLMEQFPKVWVTQREDGTWFLQKDEERPKLGLKFT